MPEQRGGVVFRNDGHCPLCMGPTTFTAHGEWLRDQYLCDRCGSIPRQRALVEVLNTVQPRWREATIHESSPAMRFFAEQCRAYSYSFYFENVEPGCYKDQHRCENLEALTFDANSFDLFVTQDVLEHVFNPDRALAEIMRVLRPDGLHIFTAPKHKFLLKSYQRARSNGDRVEHVHEPQYHGSPIGDNRSLVTWDYGADFDDLIETWSGYNTCTYVLRDRRRGIDGEHLEVFVTTKAQGAAKIGAARLASANAPP